MPKPKEMEVRVLVDGQLLGQELFPLATKEEVKYVLDKLEEIAENISMNNLE